MVSQQDGVCIFVSAPQQRTSGDSNRSTRKKGRQRDVLHEQDGRDGNKNEADGCDHPRRLTQQQFVTGNADEISEDPSGDGVSQPARMRE